MLDYSMLYPKTTSSRRAVSMNGMWKFQLDEKGEGERNGWPEGIAGDQMIPVPASFQDFFTKKDIREYTGDVWYETDAFVPGEWEGKAIWIRFGAATHRAAVYVNGVKVAEHEGGFLPFVADVTEIVRYNAKNKVVVKVNNELTETNIPCGRTMTLADGKKMNKPYFDFFNYSGLQRSVHLMAVPKEAVYDFDLTYELCGSDAKIAYSIQTTGDHPVKVSLYDADGNEAAHSEGAEGTLFVQNAHLWQVRNAYLYRLVIQIMDDAQVVDEYEQEIGIRTVEVKGTDILLNGSPVYLRGFGKHEDSDIVGRGFNIGVMKRDFELMKWIGANSFRTSHYPYSEEIYQMADREGFLIIDEVPAVGMFESLMNFAEACTGKSTGFFEK